MREHAVKHRAEDDDADDDADPQTDVMQRLDALTHFGDAGAHIEHNGKGPVGENPQSEKYQAAP